MFMFSFCQYNYHKVAFEAHAGLLRLLMKGIFDGESKSGYIRILNQGDIKTGGGGALCVEIGFYVDIS